MASRSTPPTSASTRTDFVQPPGQGGPLDDQDDDDGSYLQGVKATSETVEHLQLHAAKLR